MNSSDDHGSTGWLQTTAPVEPGSEIALRWAVYDSSDPRSINKVFINVVSNF